MKLLLSLTLLLTVTCCCAQSPFKPIPKLHLSIQELQATGPFLVSSPINAWRPIANIAAYGEPGNLLMAGAGYGLQHLSYNTITAKWVCIWSINAIGWAGGSVAPSTPASIASFGLTLGLDNNLIQVGPAYNPGTRQLLLAVAVGISLNN